MYLGVPPSRKFGATLNCRSTKARPCEEVAIGKKGCACLRVEVDGDEVRVFYFIFGV